MAYLRDRRAFGNIGTRKFRGARFGDPLSPRGPQYTKEGLILDYSTDVGPFTIIDQSGQDNTATLYSGRGLTMDGVSDTVAYGTGYSSSSRTATVWMRVSSLGARTLNGATGTLTFTPTATGVWEKLSSTATVSGDLAWTAGSDCDISDLRVGTEHWTHSDWSNPAGNTSNGKTIVDSGPNGYHGTCTGCSGFTGEGIDPEVAGIVGLDNAQWFNGTDSMVNLNSTIIYNGDFSIDFSAVKTGGDGTLSCFFSDSLNANNRFLLAGDNRWRIIISGTSYIFPEGNIAKFLAGSTAVGTLSRTGNIVSLSVNIDGVDYSDSNDFGSANAFRVFRIGNDNTTSYFNGLIYGLDFGVAAYAGLEPTPWTDTTLNNNDGTPSNLVTVGQKRATIPQTADRNWNKYQWFNGVDTAVDCGSIDITAYTEIDIEVSFFTKLAAGAAKILFSIRHSGSDDIRIVLNPAGDLIAVLDDGTAHSINFGSGYNDGNVHTLIMSFNGSVLSGTVDDANPQSNSSASFNFATASGETAIGERFGGSLLFGEGAIYDVKVSNQSGLTHAWTGLGNDPWKDTIGSNNGTESGTFTRELVSASDANDQIDALGTAILEPRRNTQQLNLFGEGEYSSTPDSDSLDVTTEATWEIWGNFYGTVDESEGYFSKYDTDSDNRAWYFAKKSLTNADEILLAVSNDGLAPLDLTIEQIPDAFCQISVTLSAGIYSAYVNGVAVTTSGSTDTSIAVTSADVLLGGIKIAGVEAWPAPRKIGSAKIYNRALTADEVLTNYDTQKSLYLNVFPFTLT